MSTQPVLGLSHLTFVVRDVERTARLFCEALGAQEVYDSQGRNFSLSREKFLLLGGVWLAFMEGEPTQRSYRHAAFAVGEAVLAKGRELFGRDAEFAWTDPAGKAQNPIGPTVLEEYARAGLRLDPWPVKTVLDGLAKVESLVSLDPPLLTIHPRCTRLIGAFSNYRRARRQGQWIDRPEDPQHPHEDVLDALRGGLRLCYPQGRVPAATLPRISARRVF